MKGYSFENPEDYIIIKNLLIVYYHKISRSDFL